MTREFENLHLLWATIIPDPDTIRRLLPTLTDIPDVHPSPHNGIDADALIIRTFAREYVETESLDGIPLTALAWAIERYLEMG